MARLGIDIRALLDDPEGGKKLAEILAKHNEDVAEQNEAAEKVTANMQKSIERLNKLYPYGADLKNNPWFNVTPPHSDNVYEDWNHDFPPAHDMFTRALRYWIENYHIDGYRMDLSHGLCGTSYNAVSNLLDYYQNGVCAADPEAYFILEHWGSSMGSDRPKLIQNGMLCWQNTNNAYCQTAMGWLKDGDGFQDANKDGYVTYCESHDEERMQYKCKKYGYNTAIKTIDSVRLGRVAANVAFNVLLNGPHMIWQYEEIGYDFSINSSTQGLISCIDTFPTGMMHQ